MEESAKAGNKYSSRIDPAREKNKDRNRWEKERKIHRVRSESRQKINLALKRYMLGEIDEDELEEAYGEDEQV